MQKYICEIFNRPRLSVFFLVSVPYHVIGKLETAADDFQVSSRFPCILLLFAIIYMELFFAVHLGQNGIGHTSSCSVDQPKHRPLQV